MWLHDESLILTLNSKLKYKYCSCRLMTKSLFYENQKNVKLPPLIIGKMQLIFSFFLSLLSAVQLHGRRQLEVSD